MTKPDTPFPKHWLYYIALKIVLIAGAVALALKLYGCGEGCDGTGLAETCAAAVAAGGYADAGGDLRGRHQGADRRRLQRGAAGGLGGGGRGRRCVRQADWRHSSR